MNALSTRIAVLGCAAFFAAMGFYALARPAAVLAIFGVRVETTEGTTEVRTVYGGFGVAVAAALTYAALAEPPWGRGLIFAVCVSAAGMAGGRIVGMAASRRAALFPTLTFLFVELTIAVLLFFAGNLVVKV